MKLVALLLLLLSGTAQAAAPLENIQSMLAKPQTLCGQFAQDKTLVGLKKPLLSSGRFCLVPGKGVLWQTIKPFPATLRLTREEIVQMQGDKVAMRMDAKQEPTIRVINSVLFSILAGDFSQLQKLFEVDAKAGEKSWSVALHAREPGLAKVIGQMTLEGGAFVQAITISEAGGDRTHIVFSAIATGPAAITAEEAKSLD